MFNPLLLSSPQKKYILKETGMSSLSYVGFSQGTAQMFAALSLNKLLNNQVNLFIALAPATRPPGLESHLVSAVMHASPEMVYLMLGKRRGLALALFWRDHLSARQYADVLTRTMHWLFKWRLQNISQQQKDRCFQHLYSYTSVKLIVHWFQIMRAGRFQAYDDAYNQSRDHVVPAYPTAFNIKTPMAIFHGSADSLSNIEKLSEDVNIKGTNSKVVKVLEVAGYEHLDFLWADDVGSRVYPEVIKTLDHYSSSSSS